MGYPPFARPEATVESAESNADTMPSIQGFLDDLPSIDDFIDSSSSSLPSIDVFLAGNSAAESASGEPEAGHSVEFDSEGWAVAGWQLFNWGGAAALGVSPQERSAHEDSWDTHEWSAAPLSHASGSPIGKRGHRDVPPTADEVAWALDGIARRIRSGELLIDQLSGTPPEAAMAAAIAALLRMRD